MLVIIIIHANVSKEVHVDVHNIDVYDESEAYSSDEVIWQEVHIAQQYNFSLVKKTIHDDLTMYEMKYSGNNIYTDLSNIALLYETDEYEVIILVQSDEDSEKIDYYYDGTITKFE